MFREDFLKNAAGMLSSSILIPGQSQKLLNLLSGSTANLSLQPSASRFIYIHHQQWGLTWSIQFPEIISSRTGMIMDWPRIRPEWKQFGTNSWGYDWEPSQEYVYWQFSGAHLVDDGFSGNRATPRYPQGFQVSARIQAGVNEVGLELTFKNKTGTDITSLRCDGGCLQANSEPFMGNDEVGRSYMMQNSRMVSMKTIDRSVPIRCTYHAAPITGMGGRFWGSSEALIDSPSIVGAISSDHAYAMVLGYERSDSASQNSDASHHCLHSRPFLGELPMGESVTIKGYILFGYDIQALAGQLKNKLTG